jgi:signal transduction histidine kinase
VALRRKLALTFVILLGLVALQGATSVVLLTQLVEGSAQLVRPALGRVDTLAHLEADVLRLHALEHARAVDLDAGAPGETAQLETDIESRLKSYASQDLDGERARRVAAIQSGYSALATARAVDRAAGLLALDDGLHQLRHLEYDVTEALRDSMVSAAHWARWPLALTVVLVALAGLGLGWSVSHAINRSLVLLSAGARRIAIERFDVPIPIPHEPEFAELAATLNGVMLELTHGRAERARLESQRLELMRGRLAQVVRAQEEERARLSRELHDEAGQALTALNYGLDLVQRSALDAATRGEVQRLMELCATTTRRLAALARDLRPSVLDDFGLLPAVRSLVREFADRYGVATELHVHGDVPRLASEAETAVYRVVQEALTNVARHARASRVDVTLETRGSELHVRVQDNGRGFDPRAGPPGIGLAGIQERVQLLEGEFAITSRLDDGTVVAVSVPVPVPVAQSLEDLVTA